MFSAASSPNSRFAGLMFSSVPSPIGRHSSFRKDERPVSPVFIGNASPQDDASIEIPVKIPLSIDVSPLSPAPITDPSLLPTGERNQFSDSIATAADKQLEYRYVRDGKWIGPMNTGNMVHNLAVAVITHLEHIDRDLLAKQATYKDSFNILQEFANSTLAHLNTLYNDARKLNLEIAKTTESHDVRFASIETYTKNTDDDMADLVERVDGVYETIDENLTPRLLELEEKCAAYQTRLDDNIVEHKAADLEKDALIDKLIASNRALSNQVDTLTAKVAKLSLLTDTSNCLIVSMQYFILYLISIFIAFCAFEYYNVSRV